MWHYRKWYIHWCFILIQYYLFLIYTSTYYS
jgi:hypothetical protein